MVGRMARLALVCRPMMLEGCDLSPVDLEVWGSRGLVRTCQLTCTHVHACQIFHVEW